ncbi:MAG TPA: SAM-dependent methyltransferase [Alphaproteobacteria bacterium]
MAQDLKSLLQDQVFAKGFVSATFSGRLKKAAAQEWEKIIVKPVLLKNVLHLQFNYFDKVKSFTKNHTGPAATTELKKLCDLPFTNIYLRHEDAGTQIQILQKGKFLVKKHAVEMKKAELDHDKTKNRLIKHSDDNAYLKILGFTDGNGNIKPSMQAKFKQINEFVKLLDNVQDWAAWDKPVHLVDCGSGNAYLTFAAFHYFQDVLKKETHMTGIDINPVLIENSNARARDLNWQNIHFEISNISSFVPATPPTIVLALHACDTATDEALMKAIQWDAEFILSVPCCHHNLQEQLRQADVDTTFKAVFRHGILRERMGDILTDSLRAALLEIMGYKTDVIQFVTTEHTARNLMIRARKVSAKPLENAVRTYQSLKDYWGITPKLEEYLLIATDLASRLS